MASREESLYYSDVYKNEYVSVVYIHSFKSYRPKQSINNDYNKNGWH